MNVADKIGELVKEFTVLFQTPERDKIRFSTCDCDYYGWDVAKHHAMHELARRGVPGKQWRIQHAVKFEVTDWTITDEDKVAKAIAAASVPAAPSKITRWIQDGNPGLSPRVGTVEELEKYAGRALDKACAGEILGEILFQADDGKYYTGNVEFSISEANPDIVQHELEELELLQPSETAGQ